MYYQTGFAANAGLIPQLAGKGDHLFTDELNHGSIIDGVRLTKAERNIYPHNDMAGLEDLLRKACRDALSWPADVSVAVNLSANQFRNHTLPQMVGKVLAETGLNPRRLQLEVTESLVITDVEGTLRQLRDLRAQGIQILMDDFGTGYCSLSYFQQFCFDKVKLDKSFVRDVAVRESRAIIEAVIGLGQKLDMGIVAEGVETEQQMGLLVETGCTHLQGYLFGRPMPKGPIVDLLYSSSCQPGVIADPGIGLDYHATAYRERLRNSQGEYDRQACAG